MRVKQRCRVRERERERDHLTQTDDTLLFGHQTLHGPTVFLLPPWRKLLQLSLHCATPLEGPCSSRRCVRTPSQPGSPRGSGRTRGSVGALASGGTKHSTDSEGLKKKKRLLRMGAEKSTTPHLQLVRVDQMLSHGLDNQFKEEPGELRAGEVKGRSNFFSNSHLYK